jgi:hypothetical protein
MVSLLLDAVSKDAGSVTLQIVADLLQQWQLLET